MHERRPQAGSSDAFGELTSPHQQQIRELLSPLVKPLSEKIFSELGEFISSNCKNSPFDFREGWIGIADIGLTSGVHVKVVLCTADHSYHGDRMDFISGLEIRIAQDFDLIDYSQISLGPSSLNQQPDQAKLPRLEHPDLWRRIF